MAQPVKDWQTSQMFKIAEIRAQKGMKAITLADALNISQPYLSQIENQKRRPSAELLHSISQILDVPIGALYADRKAIAVAGRVGAGAQVELVDSFEKGDGLYFVACPDDLTTAPIVAVEVIGDSMTPIIQPGDVLFFTREFFGVHETAINRVSICALDTGAVMVKLLRRGRDDGTFDLYSANDKAAAPIYGARLNWATPMRRHIAKDDLEIL